MYAQGAKIGSYGPGYVYVKSLGKYNIWLLAVQVFCY